MADQPDHTARGGRTDFSNLTLHIGLHKTGTTFLQRAVFPLWTGIAYVATDNLEVLLRAPTDRPVLLSREGLSGQNWAPHAVREISIARLGTMFPKARVMISFRKHSGYIASSYSQYLQRGGYLPFAEYYDHERDHGLMKRADFLFQPKIAAVQQHFGSLPFVFLQEEISSSLGDLLRDMERFIGGTAPAPETITQTRFNQSVKYHPAKLLRFLNGLARSELNPNGRYDLYHWRLKRLGLDPRSICQYRLWFFPTRPMIAKELSATIDASFADDWAFITKLARARRR